MGTGSLINMHDRRSVRSREPSPVCLMSSVLICSFGGHSAGPASSVGGCGRREWWTQVSRSPASRHDELRVSEPESETRS